MKIAIEIKKPKEIFSKLNLDDYKILIEIDCEDHKEYWGQLIIIDDITYTSRFYSYDEDVLVVSPVEEKPKDLYTTTDYKDRPETINEAEPTCPLCGCTISDAFELSDSTEIECPECYAKLNVERDIEITYNTVVLEVKTPIVIKKE